MKGVHVFDSVLQDGNAWLKSVMEQLDTGDPRVAYGALKATLHALRDRIPPESAARLGAQLPTVIRGIYFENWHLAGTPTKERHLDQFIDHVARGLPRGPEVDAEAAARAVFAAMSDMVDHGEVAKVLRMLPLELRDLWPVMAQVDAAEGQSGPKRP